MGKPRTSRVRVTKRQARSRVTNGGTLLIDPSVDHRTRSYRRFRDLVEGLTAQLDRPTAAQLIMVRRVAQLSLWCEQQEATVAGGGALSVTAYERNTRLVQDALTRLGLLPGPVQSVARQPKGKAQVPVDPHTQQMLAGRP